MTRTAWDFPDLPPDRLTWADVCHLLTNTSDGYPDCGLCAEPAELQTFDGPRCRAHADDVGPAPDPFALDAMASS